MPRANKDPKSSVPNNQTIAPYKQTSLPYNQTAAWLFKQIIVKMDNDMNLYDAYGAVYFDRNVQALFGDRIDALLTPEHLDTLYELTGDSKKQQEPKYLGLKLNAKIAFEVLGHLTIDKGSVDFVKYSFDLYCRNLRLTIGIEPGNRERLFRMRESLKYHEYPDAQGKVRVDQAIFGTKQVSHYYYQQVKASLGLTLSRDFLSRELITHYLHPNFDQMIENIWDQRHDDWEADGLTLPPVYDRFFRMEDRLPQLKNRLKLAGHNDSLTTQLFSTVVHQLQLKKHDALEQSQLLDEALILASGGKGNFSDLERSAWDRRETITQYALSNQDQTLYYLNVLFAVSMGMYIIWKMMNQMKPINCLAKNLGLFRRQPQDRISPLSLSAIDKELGHTPNKSR
jgi:hypothetical protein